jgi:hypothetical protein
VFINIVQLSHLLLLFDQRNGNITPLCLQRAIQRRKTGTYVHNQSEIRTHNPKVRVTKNHTQIIPSGYCEQCWQFHFYNENFLNEVCFETQKQAHRWCTWLVSTLNCYWHSPAQPFLVQGPTRPNDHIFVSRFWVVRLTTHVGNGLLVKRFMEYEERQQKPSINACFTKTVLRSVDPALHNRNWLLTCCTCQKNPTI